MSSDLKLEIFAFQFFQTHWNRAGLLVHTHTVSSKYPDEYVLDPKNTEIYEECYTSAVFIKGLFYHCIFYEEICKLEPDFQCSPSYILDCISFAFRRDGLFRDLTVFDLFFVSLAYVMNLALFSTNHVGYKDTLSYVHLCWAAFFDEYKEEFYRKGGWDTLKILSLSYSTTFEFVFGFSQRYIQTREDRCLYKRHAMKTVKNYKNIRSCFDASCQTVSKAWVKFHLQNCTKFDASTDMLKEEDINDPKLIEQFLLQLRRLCDPNFSKLLDTFYSCKTEFKSSDSDKQFAETILRSTLELTILTLKDTKQNVSSDVQMKIIKNWFHVCDIVDEIYELTAKDSSEIEQIGIQTNRLLIKDLSEVERNVNQTAELNKIDLSQNKGPTTNGNENKESRNICEGKPNEELKKEIDLERESPEVKSLLKMILVLGDQEAMAHIRSTLPISDTHNRMKTYKKK